MQQCDKRLVGSTAVAHAMFHFYELSIPLFVSVWLDVFDVSAATIGVVVTSGYLLIGVGAVPSGVLADVYGSRALLLLSLSGMSVGFLVLGVASSVPLLAVGTLLWGSAAGLYHPVGLSLLTREASQQGTALAYHGLAGNIGTAVGPLATAVLLTLCSWRVSAIFLAVLVLPGLAIAARVTESMSDTHENSAGTVGQGFREFVRGSHRLVGPGFALVLIVMALHGVYARGVLTFLPELLGGFPSFDAVAIYGRLFEPAQYLYAGVLLLGGLGQYAGGRLTDCVDSRFLLVGSYSCLCVVSVLFATITNAFLWLLLVCCAIGFLVYLTAPIRQALVAEHVDTDIHGISFGYTYLAVFGFGALGATLAGVLLTANSFRTLFVAFAGLAAIVVGLGVALYRVSQAS